MKTFIATLILLLGGFSWAEVDFKNPEPPGELPRRYLQNFVDNLNRQSEYLSRQSNQTCEAAYQEIFQQDQVTMSLFYGYLDADEVALDGSFSQVMAEHLQRPCSNEKPNVQTCGFQAVLSQKGHYQLTRTMRIGNRDKKIAINITAPSMSWDNLANQDVQNLYFDQRSKSNQTEKEFYKSLKDSQVVFYDGHSRIGAGPGFHPRAPLQIFVDKIRKQRVKTFVDQLSQSQNLKFLGMFACETEKYYEGPILSAAPHLGLVSTTEAVMSVANEESVLGALNSILTRKCKDEFNQAMIPQSHPNEDFNRVKNFFEYSHGGGSSSVVDSRSASGTR